MSVDNRRDDVPRRRAGDRGWRRIVGAFVRENWYRDLWLLAITIVVVVTAIRVGNVADRLVETRVTAVADSCRADTVQSDVLRTILEASIAQRHSLEKQGKRTPDGLTTAQVTALADSLLRPLGGLRPTTEEKRRLCAVRIARGAPSS